jgi:membrane associated rhomboid family serine protease
MPMAMYFDNQTTPPDDNVPFSGTFQAQVGDGSPTAVTLQSFSAQSSLPIVAWVVAISAMIGSLVFALLFRLRRQK